MALRDAVRSMAAALATEAGWRQPAEIDDQLQQHRLSAGEILGAFSEAPRATS
jgi:hypothetical protein